MNLAILQMDSDYKMNTIYRMYDPESGLHIVVNQALGGVAAYYKTDGNATTICDLFKTFMPHGKDYAFTEALARVDAGLLPFTDIEYPLPERLKDELRDLVKGLQMYCQVAQADPKADIYLTLYGDSILVHTYECIGDVMTLTTRHHTNPTQSEILHITTVAMDDHDTMAEVVDRYTFSVESKKPLTATQKTRITKVVQMAIYPYKVDKLGY